MEQIEITYEDASGATKKIVTKPRVLSLNWRRQVRQQIEENIQEGQKLDATWKEKLSIGDGGTIQDAIEAGKTADVSRYQVEVAQFDERNTIRLVQLSIDTKGNTTEEKELLSSEPDADFWQSVDFAALKKAADYFRGQLR